MHVSVVSCLLGCSAVTAARQLYAQDAQVSDSSYTITTLGDITISTLPSLSPSKLYPISNTTSIVTSTRTTSTSTSTSNSTSSETCIFKTTHTPTGCMVMNTGLVYVTETTTETTTATNSADADDGPELILPTPSCPQPASAPTVLSSAAAASRTTPAGVPYPSSAEPSTSTVRATVKTRAFISATGPAITFPPPGPSKVKTTSIDVGQVITSAFGHGPSPAPAHAGDSTGGGGSGGPAQGGGQAPGAKVNRVPVSVGSGGVVIGSHTYDAAPPTAAVQTVEGHTYTILPSSSGVVVPGGMTVTAVPTVATGVSMPEYTADTVDGIALDVGQTQAIVDGHTLPIGAGAATTTLVVNGETITFGPFGVGFPTTTIAPYLGDGVGPATFTADGAFFSFGSGDVVIDGSTYALSQPTNVVVGSETISLGTFGVNLASTTIAPPAASPSGSIQEGSASSCASRRSRWLLAGLFFGILW